jgi:hypothetical protein
VQEVTANLGRPDDPGTRALFELVDDALKQ